MAIKKDTLHPEGEPEIDIYPKTSIDQVENLQANLDALNGEIANISINVETIANRVEITENSITVLNTAYESYTDYTEVTNGFLLTYLSGRQIELPIKAGTNVTFSKYPGTNQIVINATGGSVPENIALLDAANTFTADNTFNQTTYYNNRVFFENSPINLRDSTKKLLLTLTYDGFLNSNRGTGDTYSYSFPNKTGTFALTTDITTPQYNRGIDSATPTTFTYELGVYHTLTITLLTTYVSTTIILPNDYDGSSIDIELEGKSFLIMVVAGLLSVRNTTDNTEWVGKLE